MIIRPYRGWRQIRKSQSPLGRTDLPIGSCVLRSAKSICRLEVAFSDQRNRSADWKLHSALSEIDLPIGSCILRSLKSICRLEVAFCALRNRSADWKLHSPISRIHSLSRKWAYSWAPNALSSGKVQDVRGMCEVWIWEEERRKAGSVYRYVFQKTPYSSRSRPSVVLIDGRYTTMMPTGALQGLVSLFP